MKRSTIFAQVASKCASLRTSNRNRYYLFSIIFLLFVGVGDVWGEETTYMFTSKSWKATSGGSDANWTSGKDGNQLSSGRGIQITTGTSGANGTSPKSFTNVSQVVVTYSTNASSGDGSIAVKIGDNTEVSQSVTTTGGTTDRTLTYTFTPNQTGSVKVTVTCTTNSIYLKSVAITEAASTPATITFSENGETKTETITSVSYQLPTELSVGSCDSKTFVGWTTIENFTSASTPTSDDYYEKGETVSISGNETFYAVFATAEVGGGETEWVLTANGLGDLTTSDVFVFAVDVSGTYYAMPHNEGTSDGPPLTQVEVSNNKITSNLNENLKWNISGNATDGYIFYPNGDDSKWLYCNTTKNSGNNDNIRVGTGSRKEWKQASSTKYLFNDDNATRYLSRNSTTDFRSYLNTDNNPVVPSIFKYSVSTTYSDYTTSCTTETSITLNPNGGTGSAITETISESTYTVPNCTFTRTGYTFSHWDTNADDSGFDYDPDDNINLNGTPVTLYAQWTKVHTINWSVNGTTQSLSPSSVTDGNNLGTLPTPNLDGICEGKTFVGWTTEENNNYFDETTPPLFIEATTQPEGNTTYYAVFATPEQGGTKTITFSEEWQENITNLGTQTDGYKFFDDIITLTFAKPSGQNNPAYNRTGNAIRLYYGNTMKVSSTSTIQTITLTFVSDDANTNSISTNPDCGTLPISSPHDPYTWTINAKEVTFQIGTYKDNTGTEKTSGHRKVSKIDIVTADGGAASYSNYTTSCTTTYTVTYNGNGNTGGTVPTDNNKYEENAQVTVLGNTSNLVKEGYTFAGWNTQSDGNGTDYDADATFEITKNTTLYAKWEANTYTVCFNANGGTGTMENQSFTYGAEQALSSNKFTRDSYIFAGWATTADGAVVYTDAQSVSNLTTTNGAIVTLYAQWSELYTVTFYNMGSVYTTKTQESVGGSINFPEPPSACEGYTFDGWSATEFDGFASYEAVTAITPNEDTQLYAVYSKTEDGGGNATVEDKLTRETTGVSNQTGTTVSYTDWSEIKSQSNAIYKGNSAGNFNSIQLRSDKSTSGVITTTSGGKAKKVTVVWDSNTEGDRTLNVYGKNSAYSAASDLYDNENQGTLLGTIVCGTSTELTIDGDYEYIGLRSAKNAMYLTSITITWAIGGPSTTYTTSPDCAEVYNITIDPNIEHGSVTASPMSAVAGTTISLTATPDDTYKFDSWQVTDENSNTIDVTTENTFIMPETDVTVSAIFTEKKRYTITWYANGSEYTTTDVIEDIQIAPPALPNMENYCGVFAGWTTESPVSGNFDEAPTLYNEQSEFPLATEETPKTFYAVFADVEGVIPEMPTVIAYWENQELTKDEGVSAKIGIGTMTSNIGSTELRTKTAYFSNINTQPIIELTNLDLISHQDICLSFWTRGSAGGAFTIKINDNTIATINVNKNDETLYIIENIPSTTTSITLSYGENSGSFFFGTVKLYEAPAAYSFEKLTAENTNGWTGSDWDGYYLITNADTKALDGNAIGEYSNQRVEEVDNKIECSITTAFHIIYNSEENGYSVQGVGDGDYLQQGNNTITVSSTAVYFPAISYNSLKGTDNYELQWNNDKCAFYASTQSAPQMYKIMSELSNYRTLCVYDIEYTNTFDVAHTNPPTYTAEDLPLTFTAPSAREGYTFAGWNPATLSAETRGDKEVEAQWTVNQYTVTWKLNGGQWSGGGTEDKVNNHNYGEAITTYSNPTRTGYTFAGWSAEVPATMPAENLDFTAQWTPTTYNIDWMLDGNVLETTTVSIVDQLVADDFPNDPADNVLGCCADKFIGWSSRQSPGAGDIFTKDNVPSGVITAKTYYAVFGTTANGVGTSIVDFSEMGYENGTAVTEQITLGDGEGHGDATIIMAKEGSNYNPAYYDTGEAVRVYAGGTITIASTYDGATIKSVKFTFGTSDGSNAITANSGTYADGTWTENTENPATSVTFTIGGDTGHRRIASIQVTTGVSGSQYTNYVTECTLSSDASIGDGIITYANSGTAINVDCGKMSAKSTAATLTFPNAQHLTCPVTLTASEGFVLSTNKQSDTYSQTIEVTPYKSGDNIGKLKNVYVRAIAPEMSNDAMEGTITVSGGEIDPSINIAVSATVTCEQYTLTTVDHLGNETVIGTYFAGEDIITEPTPSSDECTANYTFDGWSLTPVEYGTVAYSKITFPYEMPAEDITLYPVYSINDTEDYHRVTSDLGADNWAGDYLIAASSTILANGETSDLNSSFLQTAIDDNIVSSTYAESFKVTLDAVEGGYVLKTQDDKYNYIRNSGSSGLYTTEHLTTADDYPLTVTFVDNKKVSIANLMNTNKASLQYNNNSSNFRFYAPGNQTPVYCYKKSPLYTSYLACGTIEVTGEEVYVTATKDRGIMAPETLTVTASGMYPNAEMMVTSNSSDVYFSTTRDANFAMAAANQPKTSLTLTADASGALTQDIYVHYRPSTDGDGIPADVVVTAQSNNLPISDEKTIHVRNLPAKFVIATKAGAVWYALPANMTAATNPAGVVIEVNEENMTAIAPTTCTYTLWPVKTTNTQYDRFAGYGDRVRFSAVNNEQGGLWANDSESSNTIRNYAVIEAIGDDPGAAYEWKVTTTVVDGHWQYTLQTDQTKNQNYLLYFNSKWGTYANGLNTLYILPIEEITEMNVEVMEWGTNSMALRFDGTAPNSIDITLGETTKTNVTLTNLNSGNTSDIYKVEGLTLTTNDCEVMKIVENGNSNHRKLLRKPILISEEQTGSSFTTSPTRDICMHCDVVILNGGKLTADEDKSSHVDFANIYVYPGGKLVLDGKSLGVKQQVYVRGGYSWLNPDTYELPELYLNGNINFNGSSNIIYDYYIKNYQYYQFSLPYDVPLVEVTDEAGEDNFPVWVKHYNGALRAANPNATSWEWYNGDNFEAGIGYIIAAQPRQVDGVKNRPLSIIRFPLGNKVFNGSGEADKSITTTAHGIAAYNEGTITANNVGWNFVGNPFMATWQGDIGHQLLVKSPDAEHWNGSYHWVDDNVKYITVMSPEDGTDYKQYVASTTKLKPFFPFYLQETADGGGGTINFAAASRMKKAPAMLSAETPREAFVQIEIEAEGIIDQTGIFVSDKYSDDIDFDDYEKMFGTSTDKAKVWLMHGDKRMAFEAMTETTAAAYTPLGYRASQAGNYVFAINEEVSDLSEVDAVYLTDNITGVTDFDLLSSAYEFDSDYAVYNDTRFTIRIVLREDVPGVATSIENINTDSEQPFKFFHRGIMYIMHNGHIYNAMGKRVEIINQ